MPNKNHSVGWINAEHALILSDSEAFLAASAQKGFRTQPLMQNHALPPRSLVFSFSHDAARHTFEAAERASNKQSVFCALHVFKATVMHAEYTLDLIMKSDFDMALRTQRKVLKTLNNFRSLRVSGNNSRGAVRVLEKATPYALIAEDLGNGYIHSLAEFFEVHYAHMNPKHPCPFNFTGSLHISGILIVLRKTTFPQAAALNADLENLASLLAKHGGILHVTENIVTSFMCSEVDYAALLEKAAGPRGLALTEFAIGVNTALNGIVDYAINSQINEGIEGLHVALGDGSSGFHIDFLSPQTRVDPVSPV